MQAARPKLRIEAVVAKLARWLFAIVGVLMGGVVVLSLVRGVPLIDMAPLMRVLLTSAVPVALPVMFTVSMAVGSKERAKRGVLATRLSAAEDAAPMDGHDHDEPVGNHGRDSTRPRYRRRGPACRRTRLSGSQPGPNRPRVPRRGPDALKVALIRWRVPNAATAIAADRV